MRTSCIMLLLLACMLATSACRKNKSNTAAAGEVYIPLDLDTLMPQKALSMYTSGITYPGVAGALVACRISGSAIDTAGITQQYSRNWEAAYFAGNSSDSVPTAGSVFVNSIPVPRLIVGTHTHANLYVHYDSVIIWNDAAVNNWVVSGNGSIPAFSAAIDGTYPSYTGTLPTTISRTDDLAITFNAANTFNADAAYLRVYHDGSVKGSDVVSANGGRAVIGAIAFSSFSNGYVTWSNRAPAHVFAGGGYILIVLHKYDTRTFNGKKFVFVKQRVMIGIVNFI